MVAPAAGAQVRDGVVAMLEAWAGVTPAERLLPSLADYLASPKAGGGGTARARRRQGLRARSQCCVHINRAAPRTLPATDAQMRSMTSTERVCVCRLFARGTAVRRQRHQLAGSPRGPGSTRPRLRRAQAAALRWAAALAAAGRLGKCLDAAARAAAAGVLDKAPDAREAGTALMLALLQARQPAEPKEFP